MDPDRSCTQIARGQHGLITRQQALAAGLGPEQIRHRMRTGRWVVVRHGVYVVAGTPDDARQQVLGVCLATSSAASHLTAARLWGLSLPQPGYIDVVTAEDRRVRLPGVVQHRSETLEAADIARIGAIPLTSPARTLVDCAGLVPASRLGQVVDDALRRGLVRLDALRACHSYVDTGPGRRPTVSMREVLIRRAPGYGAGDSEREADLVRLLADAGLPAPVLGHRVHVARRRYKLDVAWPEAMAALEFDGWATHGSFSAFHGDRQRLRRIVAIGWRIIPVTAETDLHELVADVRLLLALSGQSAVHCTVG